MKEYKCLAVGGIEEVGKTIEENEKDNWQLHTYQAGGIRNQGTEHHYLLFFRVKK